MAASNYVYSYRHQLMRMNEDKIVKDANHLISPDAINMFRHAMLDVNHPDPVDHLVSSLMVKLFLCHDIEPVILYRQKQPLQNSSVLSLEMIEPLPPNYQSTLQLEITQFSKVALDDAIAQNRQAMQIRLIFKGRREEKLMKKQFPCNDEEKELECAICIDKLSKDDNNVKLTPCLHAFHEDCYYKWRRRRRSCPLCRSELPITYLA